MLSRFRARVKGKGAEEAGAAAQQFTNDAFAKRIRTRRRLLAALGRTAPWIRLLILISGYALLICLPLPFFTKHVYVDENALQPGQAHVYWDSSDVHHADRLAQRVKAVAGRDSLTRAKFVRDELRSYGLSAHTQSYAFSLPPNGSKHPHRSANSRDPLSAETLSGANAYARSPSARIDGREAVVISATWKSRWPGEADQLNEQAEGEGEGEGLERGEMKDNVRGVALLLSLANYLTKHSHWSKDLIFIVSDGYLEGMQAWTSAYFGRPQENLHAEPISGAGSMIWNAVNLDYPSDSFSALALLHEGHNGALPNMDVLNTLGRIASSVGGVPVHLHGSLRDGQHGARDSATWATLRGWVKTLLGEEMAEVYEEAARNIGTQMRLQAAGHPSGVHGLFHRFHVDAVTVYAVPAPGPYGFFHLGRIVESLTRSFSNLLERLHHSQFLYLLASPSRFVPIAHYLPASLLLSLALTFAGLARWIAAGNEVRESRRVFYRMRAGPRLGAGTDEDETSAETPLDTPAGSPTHEKAGFVFLASGQRTIASVNVDANANARLVRPVWETVAIIVACHIVGALAFSIFARAPVDCATGGIENCAPFRQVTILSALSPVALSALTAHLVQPSSKRAAVARLLHAFTLLQAGMLIAVVSTLNFSLAMGCAVLLAAPLYLLRSPRAVPLDSDGATASRDSAPSSRSPSPLSRLASLCQMLLLLLLTPSGLSYLSFRLLGPEATEEGLNSVLWDWQILGGAVMPFVMLEYTPVVLQAAVVGALGVW